MTINNTKSSTELSPVEKQAYIKSELTSFSQQISTNYFDEVPFKALGKVLILPNVFPPNFFIGPELLSKHVANYLAKFEKQTKINMLDLGSGSGVQGIVAKHYHNTFVVGIDINLEAVKCTTLNYYKHDLISRSTVLNGNLFDGLSASSGHSFDLIVFNPPFAGFDSEDALEKATTDPKYKTLQAFFEQVSDYLAATGVILLLFSDRGNMEKLHSLIQENGFKYSILEQKASNLILNKASPISQTFFVYEICRV